MNIFLLIVFFTVLFLFAVFLFFYLQKRRDLNDAYSEVRSKEKSIEQYREKVQSLEKQLRGERNPSSNCIGCKHLIISDDNPCNFLSHKRYNCRKNLRCREFEEETGAKPCL